jgi:hypothetical protein
MFLQSAGSGRTLRRLALNHQPETEQYSHIKTSIYRKRKLSFHHYCCPYRAFAILYAGKFMPSFAINHQQLATTYQDLFN